MKNLLLFPILLCGANLYATNFLLSGTIANPIGDSISITFEPVSVGYHPAKYVRALDKKGGFSFDFDIPEGYTRLDIIHGNQETEFFAEPGADLYMQMDAKNFDSTLKYTGKGQEIANFMARHVLEKNGIVMFGMSTQRICMKEPDDYIIALDGLVNEEMNFLKKYGSNLPASFKEYYEAYYTYKKYAAMDLYPQFHEMQKQHSMKVKYIPKENYKVLEKVPAAFNDKYVGMEAYREFLFNYSPTHLAARTAGDTTAQTKLRTDECLDMEYKEMPSKTAEYCAAHTIYVVTKYYTYDELTKMFSDYKKHFPNSPYSAELEQSIANKKIVAVGKKVIDFDITEPDGNKLKLSDLKGNAVYIDFWSRGCVPCLAEMPDAKKVREYFKDKPVKFVYISMDAEESVWKKAIKDYGVDGLNMHVDKNWESEVVKAYGVKGIPSYFLIDKDGKFAAIEDLARPSDTKKLIEQIEKLLR